MKKILFTLISVIISLSVFSQIPHQVDQTKSYDLITFNYSGIIQDFVVPVGINIVAIKVIGAQGGTYNFTGGTPPVTTTHVGGKGAFMQGDFTVTPGDTIKVLVGQQGGTHYGGNGGGGGGSFVWHKDSLNPMIIAGGGGGGGLPNDGIDASITTNGTAGNPNNFGSYGTGGNGAYPGGCGWYSSGGNYYVKTTSCNPGCGALPYLAYGGTRPLDGGAGGCGMTDQVGNGGFGGGSGAAGNCTTSHGAGGGGGYSGGVGCSGGVSGGGIPFPASGGGGGSYNNGANQVNIPGYQNGNGQVIFLWAVVVGTDTYKKSEFHLFPNPASTTLTIVGITENPIAEIFDISGKLLLSKQLNSNQIDISPLAKGLYFIKLSTAEGSVVRKFVKE